MHGMFYTSDKEKRSCLHTVIHMHENKIYDLTKSIHEVFKRSSLILLKAQSHSHIHSGSSGISNILHEIYINIDDI